MRLLKNTKFSLCYLIGLIHFSILGSANAAEGGADTFMGPVAEWAEKIVFFEIPWTGIPFVLVLLVVSALFFTINFGFINVRGLKRAVRTVSGRYSKKSDPGEITHFQALSSALSATVGLGNIAGVAIAITVGGPGATFWMILCGPGTKVHPKV